MRLARPIFTAITLALFLAAVPVAAGERTMFLNLCQELVNSARSYEARASHHQRTAKNLQAQIENMARLPNNQATNQAIDTLFSQYDENRVMEAKFRELYRQSTEEAKKCMKSAD
jgi:hypothetical protein